ncbi:DUF5723 family protein [Bacteroidota bacterium]
MRVLLRYTLVVCIVTILAWPQASAQFGNTYYHMLGVPQANQLNPAFQPSCNGYLGLPLLSPLRLEVESSSLSYGDIFQWDRPSRKYQTFLHPEADKQKFLDALEPLNMIRMELATNILSTGWRNGDLFFTLDFTERFIQDFSYPEDFAKFLVNGVLDSDNLNFSDFAENLSFFHELSIGASYNYEDEFQLGIRAKLLLGVANYSTKSSEIALKTTIDEWDINSDIMVNASIPFLENIPVDSEGNLDLDTLGNIDSDEIFDFPSKVQDLLRPSGRKAIGGFNNPGFAIDLGFNYQPIEKLSVSASVVDLGFIRWKNYVHNIHQDMEYTFEGVEIRIEEGYSVGEGLLDSLKDDMKVEVSQNPYTTMLAGKVFIGAAYSPIEMVRLGGVFRSRIQNYKFYNQITASANVQPISMFSMSLSYSYYWNSYMNLGLGLSLRLGPLNLYFVTDQAPSAYFFPKELSSINFRLGMNIVWGCKAMPKAMKDRPLID